jgi:hypothetical protein
MSVMNVNNFERFFRAAASLDVDKGDLRKYNDFLDRKMYDLLLRAQAATKANGRDIIWPADLPITKGLQQDIHAFREIDEQIDLEPILEALTKQPPLDYEYSDLLKEKLPEVAGGLSVALARSFKVVEPGLKNPNFAHWDRAFRLFDLLV